jgi:hypothetical protein
MSNHAKIAGPLPVAAGVARLPTTEEFAQLRARRARLSERVELADLTTTHTLYQPGLMYCGVPFSQRFRNGRAELADPFLSFLAEYRLPDLAPLQIPLPLPAVDGFQEFGAATAGWNQVLHALEPPIFELYAGWLASIVFYRSVWRQAYRVRLREVPLTDLRWLARTAVLPARIPLVRMTVFEVLGGDWELVVTPPAQPWLPYRVCRRPADHADLRQAAQCLPQADAVDLPRLFLDPGDSDGR